MSRVTDSWIRCYDAQTRMLADSATNDSGARTATVNGVTGRAIVGTNALTPKLQLSSFTDEGGITFQMLASDFGNTEPPAQCPVEIMDVPNLYMADVTTNNGIFYFTAQDRNKR